MTAEAPADPVPDDELLRRIVAGDAHAFAALYRHRHRHVYRFALHMTASAPVAEDVTQEVFLAVMRDAERYEPGRATVIAWLCGIARNQVRRHLERDRALRPLADDDEPVDGPGPPGDRGNPLDDLIRAERIDSLRRAILALPVRYREAVVLCDLQELSYADAAEALACALGTVRSRLHRGRALLVAKMSAIDAAGTRAVEGPGERKPGDATVAAGGCFA